MNYRDFIASKSIEALPIGILDPPSLSPVLFPFQSDIVTWALRRGRAAVFAGTGLGKSKIQSEWGFRVHDHTGGSILILAPLAVAPQTVQEAASLGVTVIPASSQADCTEPGIYITNYQKLQHFNPSWFEGVILDESSVIKHHDAKTRDQIIKAFKGTRWKLACTATPAPNDFMELGNHAEFLEVMTMAEMLSMFFVHDGGSTKDWRLKGHAQNDFWKWLASWAVCINKPSDLGYEDGAFLLPPLNYHVHEVKGDLAASGLLLPVKASTLQECRDARRGSISARCEAAAAIVNATDEPWLIWCDLNDESQLLTKLIDGAEEVTGSDDDTRKESIMMGFSRGEVSRLVSKPSICGFGMNWQHCRNVIFVGVTHSFERFYQAVRRCWRFGQTREVNVHIVISDQETGVLDIIRAKEADAESMLKNMIVHMADISSVEIRGAQRTTLTYNAATPAEIPSFLAHD